MHLLKTIKNTAILVVVTIYAALLSFYGGIKPLSKRTFGIASKGHRGAQRIEGANYVAHNGQLLPVPAGGAANDMISGEINFYDDFTGPFSSATNGLIASKMIYVVADGTTCTKLGINGSAARIAIGTDEGDALAMYGPPVEIDEAGLVVLQVRLRTSDVDKSSIFIGFSDAVTDTVIIEDEDNVLAAVASDAFGILLEGENDTTWRTVGVDSDTLKAEGPIAAAAGIDDLTDSEWTTIRIEADASNSGRFRFYVDGVLATTANTNSAGFTTSAFDSSIVYYPVISADGRATAYNVDVAEVSLIGGNGTVFD